MPTFLYMTVLLSEHRLASRRLLGIWGDERITPWLLSIIESFERLDIMNSPPRVGEPSSQPTPENNQVKRLVFCLSFCRLRTHGNTEETIFTILRYEGTNDNRIFCKPVGAAEIQSAIDSNF